RRSLGAPLGQHQLRVMSRLGASGDGVGVLAIETEAGGPARFIPTRRKPRLGEPRHEVLLPSSYACCPWPAKINCKLFPAPHSSHQRRKNFDRFPPTGGARGSHCRSWLSDAPPVPHGQLAVTLRGSRASQCVPRKRWMRRRSRFVGRRVGLGSPPNCSLRSAAACIRAARLASVSP